jgi:hypothetical protein
MIIGRQVLYETGQPFDRERAIHETTRYPTCVLQGRVFGRQELWWRVWYIDHSC